MSNSEILSQGTDTYYPNQRPAAELLTFESLPLKTWPEQWQPSAEFPTPQSALEDDFSRVANDALSFSGSAQLYRIGEPHLPVAAYREHYLRLGSQHDRLVVSAETGSGKTSQLPLYELENGASRVFVSSPRIIAARENAARARQNLGPDYAHLVGYLTGTEADSDCGPDARLIHVTEQLLFKMANRGELNSGDVIIPDEVHEKTTPMVIFLGRLKKVQSANPGLKIRVCSATIDTDKYAQYLADPVTGEPAPVLILPGRTHPIKKQLDSAESVAVEMRNLMNAGKNVLTFEPGVSRMKSTKAKAQSRRNKHTVHLLYGDQSPAEQKAALTPDDKNHIVATRIGETSITPEGKDAVVDSGLSNVGRYTKGVRGLETIYSSQDTLNQRMGRVGRTKPGVYVLAVPSDAPPPPAFEDRPEYGSPDIQNSSVANYILELLCEGIRIEDLDLLDSPTHENLEHDYLVLKRLGAIALLGDEVVVTTIGEAMTDIPLDASLARMVIEARRLALNPERSNGAALLLQVAAAAAVQQVKGIISGSQNGMRQATRRAPIKELLSEEQISDVLYELDVFTALYSKQQELLNSDALNAEVLFEKYLEIHAIRPNRYYKALRTYEELCHRERLIPNDLRKADSLQREQIITCQISGVEELFVRRGKRVFNDIRDGSRRLGRQSTINTLLAELVMGVAFDFDGLRTSGRYYRHFISGASAVSLEQIRQQVPQRLTERSTGYQISRNGAFVERKSFFFDGELQIGEIEEAPAPTLATRHALITAMMTGVGRNALNDLDPVAYNPGTQNATSAIKRWQEAQKLEHRVGANLNTANRYQSLIRKVVRQSVETIPLDVVDPAVLDALIPRVYLKSLVRPTKKNDIPEIIRKSPDGISIHVGDDEKEYVPVNYKHNIAYVAIGRDQLAQIKREDFAELIQYHDVKIKIGHGKYLQFEAAFALIDEQLQARAEKLDRRERSRNVSDAAQAITHAPSAERERAPIRDDAKEASARALTVRTNGVPRQRTARRAFVSRSSSDTND